MKFLGEDTMKFLKITFAALLAFAYGNASAFHSGGVAECEGCHSMHNSFENAANVTGMPQFQSGPYLLKAQNQAGVCLNCHEQPDTAPSSYHISTKGVKIVAQGGDGTHSPVEMTPGGDFAWLKTTRTGMVRGNPVTWEGDRQGHNIVSVDYGFTQDKVQVVAPGGTYPAANLACSSCHDPHGRYRRLADGSQTGPGTPGATMLSIFGSGSYPIFGATQGGPKYPTANLSAAGVYRLLAGVGYQPRSLSGSYAFVNPSPDAVAPSTYNRSEAVSQTHVAYGQGMSEWCANCHTQMLQNNYVSGMKGLTHPAGNNAHLTPTIVLNYNSYVASGNLSNTDPLKAWSSLVPFEMGTNDYTVLEPLAVTVDTKDQSASTNANVMCLSCHRAHASAFESMTRFYTGNEFITIADASSVAIYDPSTTENKINTAYTAAEQTNAYYGRPATKFAAYQRNLCNKCHAKD
jgi:hypothetical protein